METDQRFSLSAQGSLAGGKLLVHNSPQQTTAAKPKPKNMIKIVQDAIAFVMRILGIITTSNDALTAANATIAEQTATLAAQAQTIKDLQEAHAADELDDTALETAAADSKASAEAAKTAQTEAEAKAQALADELAALQVEGDKLAKVINDNPELPNVEPQFGLKNLKLPAGTKAKKAVKPGTGNY